MKKTDIYSAQSFAKYMTHFSRVKNTLVSFYE